MGDGIATRCDAPHGLDADLAGSGWVSLAVVVDRARNELRAYTNGQLANSTSISTLGSVDNTFAFFIGDETYLFRGIVDEVWVMHGALDYAAVAARHANIAARASFVVVGPEEQL